MKEFIAKIGKVKNIEIIIAVCLGVILLAVFLVGNAVPKTDEYGTFEKYVYDYESLIEKSLRNVEGIKNIDVVITFESGVEQVFAYETVEKTVNGTTTLTSEIILHDGEPILLKEIAPKIMGVVVTVTGSDEVAIKYKIKAALITLLNINENDIEVFVKQK